MNACVKTGARVHCVPYGYVFAADIFKVGSAFVVRANGPIVQGENAWPVERFCASHRPTHELLDDLGKGFWREDLGIFVIPEDKLREL